MMVHERPWPTPDTKCNAWTNSRIESACKLFALQVIHICKVGKTVAG